MKKIGILDFSYMYGGVNQYTQSIIDAFLNDKKNKYVIFCSKEEHKYDHYKMEVRKINISEHLFIRVIRLIELIFNVKLYKLKNKEYFLISAHREENIDSDINFQKLSEILNTLASKFKIPIIVSTHPRTQKRVSDSNLDFNPLVNFLKPLGFHDYVKLQMESKAVLSDSGTINEEASILNFRALNIRETHERPEGMEEGAVIMVGMNLDRIMQSLFILSDQAEGKERNLRIVSDYSMPNVSDKILRIIHSYSDYINRVVWKKY